MTQPQQDPMDVPMDVKKATEWLQALDVQGGWELMAEQVVFLQKEAADLRQVAQGLREQNAWLSESEVIITGKYPATKTVADHVATLQEQITKLEAELAVEKRYLSSKPSEWPDPKEIADLTAKLSVARETLEKIANEPNQ